MNAEVRKLAEDDPAAFLHAWLMVQDSSLLPEAEHAIRAVLNDRTQLLDAAHKLYAAVEPVLGAATPRRLHMPLVHAWNDVRELIWIKGRPTLGPRK